jgi:hypothetical protein
MNDCSLVKEQLLARTRAGVARPLGRATNRFGGLGSVFRGRGSGPATLVALEVRDSVAAGPAYLDEAWPEAGHSRLGKEARADPKAFCDLSGREQPIAPLDHHFAIQLRSRLSVAVLARLIDWYGWRATSRGKRRRELALHVGFSMSRISDPMEPMTSFFPS